MNTPQVYRIERRGSGVLHLYRGDVLVDVDRETDRDSRSDVERWGSGVAWAEDHTVIERWDEAEQGADWQILTGIAYRYVTWHSDDEGITVWDELDSTGWATRHIEAEAANRYVAAASLQEVTAARDTGGIEAVRSYEATYGVVPEAQIPQEIPQEIRSELGPISALEFVRRWTAARAELESRASA